jgi:acyl dehydratase
MTEPARHYFEDVVVGEVVETPGLTVTETHVSLYLGLTRDLAAPGEAVPSLLGLCLLTGLAWRAPRPPLVVLAFMSLEWTELVPLRVGDTVRSRARTTAKRAMREGGVIIEERELVNQRGEVAQQSRFTLLVARRPAK